MATCCCCCCRRWWGVLVGVLLQLLPPLVKVLEGVLLQLLWASAFVGLSGLSGCGPLAV